MSFLWELRYAVRSLTRTPGLAAALVATVAVGIGTHATMTGFTEGLTATNSDIPRARDLVLIDVKGEPAVRNASAAFDAVSTFRESRAQVAIDGHAAWMPALNVSPEFWRVLAIPAGFGSLNGVVISRRIWYDHFNLSPSVIGAPITINGREMRIAGVAPTWLTDVYFGRPVDLWVPLDEQTDSSPKMRDTLLARLAAGRRFEDVRRELSPVSVVRYTGVEPEVYERMARVEAILSWAATFVFLTAAANVAGFLLSRSSRRSHGTAARLALGATDHQLTRQILADSLAIDLDLTVASAGYFASIGAPIVAGEPPAPAPCDTAVVNREAAHQYFNDQAVGGALIEPDGHRAEIVGVVDDSPLRVTQRRADPTVFYLPDQHYIPPMTAIAGPPAATPELIESVTRRLRGVAGGSFAGLPGTAPVVTLDEQLARTALGPDRIASSLVAASALIAIALALLGVYSVMADSVVQKRREIAVRLALGARGWKVIVDILAAGVRIAGVGAVAGLAASFIVIQLVVHSTSGFGLPAAWIWFTSPVIPAMLVALASILPARHALAVDPLTLTREE